MSFIHTGLARWLALSMAALLSPVSGIAQSPPEDHPDETEEIVTTGLRVSQGGAQDINFFRGEVAFARIPHPETLTAEGLMSEHDIVLPAARECRQLFCLTGEASRADLIAVPHARYLAGIGFATNMDERKWRRKPLNLIAVVDKSGSMDGEPLELVRQSLAEIARLMRSGDQLTIVLYGDTAHVHLPTRRVAPAIVGPVLRSIEQIESAGSTSMEAGLRLGYQIAGQTAPEFKGRTRLMLFTDERPNTDATDAESFMALASDGSKRGHGLTTVGVGVQFDAKLATEIGSVRGGNLYFLRDEQDVRDVFHDQFDFMVSELAHDLKLTITPHAGLKIAGVYGVPGALMGWQDESTVAVTIPTVFLDNRGGGIFVSLAPEPNASFLPPRATEGPLASVSVTYLPIDGEPGKDAIEITMQPDGPSRGMALGSLLVDEFTVLHEATSAHYLRNDQETAYRLVSSFRDRLGASRLPGLDGERELIGALYERISFLSGHGGEPDSRIGRLWGRWQVVRADEGSDLAPGDFLEFTADNRLRVLDREGAITEDDTEYECNDSQIHLPDADQLYRYRVRGGKLSLRELETGIKLQLVRAPRS
jgi:Ca-activated chloride channel family protein